ncbi:orotate phosphoribosyltransferase [Cohnella sp. OV330]|uniref:hypothetical protein n=1 Tax=Cohnella sp. OV330 TaxID=1855288 RepID=UPI0008EC2AAF|nr:hypothetical protein [Cohnella sp. OV330]SFB04550.1 orotate phosphoribosyltransferase [Cohnella sp. OV330]
MSFKGGFIEFLFKSNVLIFGDFVEKRQRDTLHDKYRELGPAYKGIPLAVAASTALYNKYKRDISVTFNRKEKKDHGEGGQIIGHMPQSNDRIAIIEDVITAGTAVRESLDLIGTIAEAKVSNELNCFCRPFGKRTEK